MKVIKDKKEVVSKTIGELKIGDTYLYRDVPYMKIDPTIKEKKKEPELAEPVDVKEVEKEESEAKSGVTYSVVVNLADGRCRKVSDILKVKVVDACVKITE